MANNMTGTPKQIDYANDIIKSIRAQLVDRIAECREELIQTPQRRERTSVLIDALNKSSEMFENAIANFEYFSDAHWIIENKRSLANVYAHMIPGYICGKNQLSDEDIAYCNRRGANL